MIFRGRVNTVAVMNTVKKPTGLSSSSSSSSTNNKNSQSKEGARSGINPR